ncbi:hypothetical protein GF337_19470 [candidate division KSB1 bacterium]|nr:hypothetical protein [candidate division KSB1 bacterium]
MISKVRRYFNILSLLAAFFIIITFIFGIQIIFDHSIPENYPFVLKKQKSYLHTFFEVNDSDKNGYSEIYTRFNRFTHQEHNATQIEMLNDELIPIQEYSYNGILYNLNFSDVTGDGVDEIVVWILRSDTAYIDIRTIKNNSIAKFAAITTDEHSIENIEKWNCSGYLIDHCDVNGDGTKELIFIVCTSYGKSPRGIYAFDISSGKIIWSHKMGAAPTYWITGDINGDGSNEYIIGSSTPENVTQPINGTKDDIAYLFVFNHQGKLLFRDSVGTAGAHVVPFVGDINHDNVDECIIIKNCFSKRAQQNPSMIYLLEPANYTLKPIIDPLPQKFYAYAMDDFDRDGIWEFLLIDHQYSGFLYSIDRATNRLKLKKKTSLNSGKIFPNIPVTVHDINFDGSKEIIIRGYDRFHIIESDLSVNAISSNSRTAHIVHRGKEKPLLVANLINGSGCETLLYTKNPFYLFYRIKNPVILVSISGLFIILFILFRLGHRLIHHSASLNQDIPWIEIDRKIRLHQISDDVRKMFGVRTLHISHALQPIFGEENANKLILAIDNYRSGKNPGSIELSLPDGSIKHVSLDIITSPSVFRNNRIIVIFREAEKDIFNRFTTWLTIIRAMIHNLKNPLTTSQLLLHRLQHNNEEADQIAEKFNIIEQEVGKTKTSATRFLAFIDAWQRKPRPCDINEMIRKLAVNMKNEHETECDIKLNLHPDLPHTRIVHDLLSMALENVVRNAVDATDSHGQVLISTNIEDRFEQKTKSFHQLITIEIADDGKGIPHTELEKAFTVGHSTKPDGSGIGLALTREILHWFEGSIDIRSKVKVGTTVTIGIPVHK